VNDSAAASAVAQLVARGQTVALAESLTGGMLAARLIDVPGASAVVRGGVVAYATDVKSSVLDVSGALLDEHGPVHPQVAVAMAEGVRRRLAADVGVATTGVAGPDPQGSAPVGLVYVAIADARGTAVREARSHGTRATIRGAAVDAALALLLDRLARGE
jgi:nicotinamide-nucleotide amidase